MYNIVILSFEILTFIAVSQIYGDSGVQYFFNSYYHLYILNFHLNFACIVIILNLSRTFHC